MDQSSGYLPKVMELLNKIETEQYDNIRAAAKLMADAIENDRLINVYGGGGHKAVGTCQFTDENMDEQLPKLIDEIVNYKEN